MSKTITIGEVKNMVLEDSFKRCLEDYSYLQMMLEWAHRDYTDDMFISDFASVVDGDDDLENATIVNELGLIL